MDLLIIIYSKINKISESFILFKEKNKEIILYITKNLESWLKIKDTVERVARVRN